MKKICLLAITAAAMWLLSGCSFGIYSNMTGCMLTIDQQVTVAHLSSIKDNTVWEADGNCYVQTPVSVYDLNNNILSSYVKKDYFNYFILNKKDTDFSRTHWVQINPEVKDFLCSPDASGNFAHDWARQSGKMLTNPPDLSKAKKHNIKLALEYRTAYRGRDVENIPEPNIKLHEKESGVRYYLIPAALVTFPLDIVMTITMHCPIVGLIYLPFLDDREEILAEQSPQIKEERQRQMKELEKKLIQEFSNSMYRVHL